MNIKIGLENNIEGRSLAWALEYPGLFAYGADGDGALSNFPAAIQAYAAWFTRHGGQPPFHPQDVELQVEQTWECYFVDETYERVRAGAEDAYEVNAWFLHDWKPLALPEIERSLELLSWSRSDLLESVAGLEQETLSARQAGERWSIAGILAHVGGAEWWYLDRLGLAFPLEKLPKDPFQRLEKVRALLVDVLPTLAGFRRVVGIDAEFWSPRKLLRRAIWHELDHISHIHKLIQAAG